MDATTYCKSSGISDTRPRLGPAAAAEAVEIARQDDLDRGRHNVEARQGHRRGRDDVVALQQLDLVRRQRRGGGGRHQPRPGGGEAPQDAPKPAPSPRLPPTTPPQPSRGRTPCAPPPPP